MRRVRPDAPWPVVEPPKWAFLRERSRRVTESLLYLGSKPFSTLFTCALIGVSLSLPSAFWLIRQNLDVGIANAAANRGISVYFAIGTPEQTIEAIADQLRITKGVLDLTVINSDAALRSFEQHVGFVSELSEFIDNPLPASIEVDLTDGSDQDATKAIAESISDNDAIEDIVIDSQWMLRLSEIKALISSVTNGLAILLGICALLATVATVRTAVETKLEETRILFLLGGSDPYLRRPFLYCGVLYGFGGGVVASLIIAAITSALAQPIATFGDTFEISHYNAFYDIALVAIGVFLGLLGALYVTRFELNKRYQLP